MFRCFAWMLTLVMVAHSLAGCCCHHAHAAQASTPTACSHASHPEHGHGESGSDESPGEPAPCDEQQCVFVRGDSGNLLDSLLAQAADQPIALNDVPQLEPLRLQQMAPADPLAYAPHARLHLVHQILLI